MKFRTTILPFLLCLTGLVFAQAPEEENSTPPPAGEESKVVEELKYKQHPGLAYAASKIYFSDKRYSISGFGEVSAVAASDDQSSSGGDLELYYTNLYRLATFMGYKIKPNLIFNFEFLGEFLHDGTREYGRDIVIEAMLDHLIHQNFNLRFGFYPLPIGYINNHDEPVMFRSVNRPEVERLIIPSSWISLGVMGFGAVPRTERVTWSLGVVGGLDAAKFQPGSWLRQGRQIHHGLPKDAAAHAQLGWSSGEHMQMGVSGYYGQSGAEAPDVAERVRATTSLGAVHFRYVPGRASVVGLASMGGLRNTEGLRELTGRTLGARTNGMYVEPSYAFRNGKLPLFARFERLNTHARVAGALQPFRANEGDLRIVTTGVNYLPRRNLVFKANYQFRQNRSPFGAPEANLMEFGFGFIY